MKLRVIDPNTGIKVWELSEFVKFRKAREKEEDMQPPPLWIPKPKNHDPEGRNKR